MITKVQKWGNSFGVRLPKAIMETCKLSENVSVELVSNDSKIIIRRKRSKKYSLSELVSQIKPSNKHAELMWGAAKGNEIW